MEIKIIKATEANLLLGHLCLKLLKDLAGFEDFVMAFVRVLLPLETYKRLGGLELRMQ